MLRYVPIRRDSAVKTILRVTLGVLLVIVVSTPATRVSAQAEQSTTHHQKLTFDGDVALWTVAIKPDKTADFEQIMAKMREALSKSADPQRRQQADGWKIMKIAKPLPDGNVAYVHIVNPVVKGADYTIMQTLYDAYPDERQTLYELYRGAFAQNLSLATGSIAVDLSTVHP
jgi:hypothetical protein